LWLYPDNIVVSFHWLCESCQLGLTQMNLRDLKLLQNLVETSWDAIVEFWIKIWLRLLERQYLIFESRFGWDVLRCNSWVLKQNLVETWDAILEFWICIVGFFHFKRTTSLSFNISKKVGRFFGCVCLRLVLKTFKPCNFDFGTFFKILKHLTKFKNQVKFHVQYKLPKIGEMIGHLSWMAQVIPLKSPFTLYYPSFHVYGWRIEKYLVQHVKFDKHY
jgi:hypothetical protein